MILIPVEQIHELAHFRFGQNYNFVEITSGVIDDKKAVFELEGFKDGPKFSTYPNLILKGSLIFKSNVQRVSMLKTPLVNPELLVRFQGSLEYLTGVKGLGFGCFLLVQMTPIYVQAFKDVYGLVMPMSQDYFFELIDLIVKCKAIDSLSGKASAEVVRRSSHERIS